MINDARGEVVDEFALADALKEKKVGGEAILMARNRTYPAISSRPATARMRPVIGSVPFPGNLPLEPSRRAQPHGRSLCARRRLCP